MPEGITFPIGEVAEHSHNSQASPERGGARRAEGFTFPIWGDARAKRGRR